MKTKKILATIILAGILGLNMPLDAAYAVNDKPTRKELKAQKKLEKERLSKIEYINIEWWDEYKDPYLNEYIYKALNNNHDLKTATLKVEEARLATNLQLSKELPTVSIGASPLLYKLPGTTNTEGLFSMPLIASYEADVFLKNRDKTRSVKKLYDASKYKEKATYIAIVSAVGSTYYNIVKIDKLITLQQQIIKDRKQIYELMKQSNEVGLVSTSDLVKSEKAYIASTTALIDLEKSRSVLLNLLCVLTGDSPANANSINRISYDKLTVMKKIPSSISSDIITARPDYLVAQKMVEKSGIDVRVAKKEFLPTITLLGLSGLSVGSAVSPTFNWENAIAAAVASAMMPLFTGGARIANLKINKNRYEQALQNYYQTNLTAIQEVNDSLSNLKYDNEKYVKNLKTYNMEKKDFGFTQMKYDAGIISNLDLLQHRETLYTVNKLVVSGKIDYYVNQISLYKAVAAENI